MQHRFRWAPGIGGARFHFRAGHFPVPPGLGAFCPVDGSIVRFEDQGPGSLELAGLQYSVFLQASMLFHFVAQVVTANGRTARPGPPDRVANVA